MYKDRIDSYFSSCEADLIDILSRLIAVRSVKGDPLPGAPFGEGPANALALALEIARDLGFETQNVDNYVGTVDLNRQETLLNILCHLDVVGEGSGWSTDPYQAVVKDGILYGRGSSDDKGPAVASLFALKAVRDLGIPLRFNARLILGTDEESGSADIRYYFARQKPPKYTFSPDGAFPVVNIEKGRLKGDFSKNWAPSTALPRIASFKGGYRANVIPPEAEAILQGFGMEELKPWCARAEKETGVQFSLADEQGGIQITARGKSNHASTPEKGNNAITGLLALLATLPFAPGESFAAVRAVAGLFPHGDVFGDALGIAQADEISGRLTISLDIFELTPSGCKGVFDTRTPLCASRENCENNLREKFSAQGFHLDGHLTPGHHTPCDSDFVKTLLSIFEQYTGIKGGCSATGGGTYVHDIEGGVSFGAIMPGFETFMHGANERMSVQNLILAAKIYAQTIIELCR